MNFTESLSADFQQNANRALAIPMENYMKNKFNYFGIKT
jgi:3-methyladenine DNA glycosylase AlkD